jgi:hypothetical protein
MAQVVYVPSGYSPTPTPTLEWAPGSRTGPHHGGRYYIPPGFRGFGRTRHDQVRLWQQQNGHGLSLWGKGGDAHSASA